MEMPLKVAELDHVVFRCRDLDAALRFYIDVLGLKEERRIPQIGLVQLRAGSSMIDLVPATSARSEEGANVDHVCLGVSASDLAEVVTYLRDQGVRVAGEPAQRYGARGMGWSVYVYDPEGNMIELKQLPPSA